LLVHIATLNASIADLEAHMAKNSLNSRKSPSSDGLNKDPVRRTQSLRKSSGKSTGGQKGHPGRTLNKSTSPDQVIPHLPPAVCDACQDSLGQPALLKTRQVFDLPPMKLDVIEHQVFGVKCSCGKAHQGEFPEGVDHSVQYGPNIMALAVHLTHHQMLPLRRTQDLLRNLFGTGPSEASILAARDQATSALADMAQEIRQGVLDSPVLHADETGMRSEGELYWVHVAATPWLTWLESHKKRGPEAMHAIGLLPNYDGICVHDCLPGYFGFDFEHAICNAHIGRELVFCHEQEKQPWAKQLKNLLWTANQEVKQTGHPLPPERLARYQHRYDSLLGKGEALNPDPPSTGKRGRIKRTTSGNLLIRLRKHRDAVWRFATTAGVPFSNNVAEQAVRMPKVKQKVAGCFRTVEGLSAFCLIRSCLATMLKQKINPLRGLKDVFQGKPLQLVTG
jgi:transposase